MLLKPGLCAFSYHVQLIVEYKEVARRTRLSISLRFKHLDGIDVEEAAEHLVHRKEGGSHTTSAREKTPPIHAQLLACGVTKFFDPLFDLLLLVCLRSRHVFTVRDHPGRNG